MMRVLQGHVQGHVIKALSSSALNATETAAFFAPTDPPSAASLSEVDGLVVKYIRRLMDDLLTQYRQLEGDEMKAREFGGLLNVIGARLKQSHHRASLSEYFLVTNRIHYPLAHSARKEYTNRLIIMASRVYSGLSTTYPLRPEGHQLEAIGIILGCLLNSGHTVATMKQREALKEIVLRGQRFRAVAHFNILRRERMAVDEGLADTGGGISNTAF